MLRDKPIRLIEANSSRAELQIREFFSGLTADYCMHRTWNGVSLSPYEFLFV
jgi:hypothetical protein